MVHTKASQWEEWPQETIILDMWRWIGCYEMIQKDIAPNSL